MKAKQEVELLKIGKHLKELLKEKNMTQQELADLLGMSEVKSVNSWANNRTGTKFENVLKIADIFDVSVDYLIGRTDSRHIGNKEIAEAIGLSESSIEVLREFAAGGHSRVNIWMINYILEHYRDSGAKNQITILWSLWSYIFAADLVYLGNVKESDNKTEVFSETLKKWGPDPEDRVTFYDKSRNAFHYLDEPEKLFQASVMDDIQAYLREQAEAYKQKRDKEECSLADDTLFQSINKFVEEAEASSKSRKGSETRTAPDDKQIKQKKGRK